MREKKVRGINRKINKLIKRIEENTIEFPLKFYDNEYRDFPLPVSQEFINSNKTPPKVKRKCIQTYKLNDKDIFFNCSFLRLKYQKLLMI